MKEPMEFAGRLKWMRERRGISRRTLSELCGLSKNVIALYERSEAQPTMEALVAIAEFFGVTVDYLIGRA